MRNVASHSVTIRKKLNKSKTIFKAFNNIQLKYGEALDKNNNIVEIFSNVRLEGTSYTSDFVCVKDDAEFMVRECVKKDKLLKPLTIKLLDISRNHWKSKGVDDWGIVINKNSFPLLERSLIAESLHYFLSYL